jgi:hypothetical protein
MAQYAPAARRFPSAKSDFFVRILVSKLQFSLRMLKLLGSFALAKLLGFGLIGAIVIYALLTLLT